MLIFLFLHLYLQIFKKSSYHFLWRFILPMNIQIIFFVRWFLFIITLSLSFLGLMNNSNLSLNHFACALLVMDSIIIVYCIILIFKTNVLTSNKKPCIWNKNIICNEWILIKILHRLLAIHICIRICSHSELTRVYFVTNRVAVWTMEYIIIG